MGSRPLQTKAEPAPTPAPTPAPAKNPTPPGGGKALSKAVRGKMETAFGQDFSRVRVHEDAQAESIGAMAFTRGHDIHFAPGKYSPKSQAGQELLGHELTHVVQQKAGRVAVPQGSGLPINDDKGLEAEADALGKQAASGRPAIVRGAATDKPQAARKPVSNSAAPSVSNPTAAAPVQCNPGDKKKAKKSGDNLVPHLATYAAIKGTLAGQGWLTRYLAGRHGRGFYPGILGLMRNLKSFKAAPWQIKAASGVLIGAGMAATRPINLMNKLYNYGKGRHKTYTSNYKASDED